MKWKYFFGACLVVGGALVKAGAPLFAVAAGIVLAALLNLGRHRRRSPKTLSGRGRRVGRPGGQARGRAYEPAGAGAK